MADVGFEGLPYGENQQANDLLAQVGDEPAVPLFAEELLEDDDMLDDEDGLVDEDDDFILSPTDRPAEPITAGAPFGPGPAFTRYAYESEERFRSRMADQLQAEGDPEVRRFAERLRRGL